MFRLRTVSRPPPAESADTTLAGQIEVWHRYAERYFYGTWTPALEADLWAHPLPLHLYLQTEVDLDTGEFNVTQRAQ